MKPYIKSNKKKQQNKIIIDMSVRIGDNLFNATYLSKPEDIQKGMMGREKLDGCMVFRLKKGPHSFWMKNCLIPLDIVYVLNNKINKIHHNCEPCHDGPCEKRYRGIGDHVIEFPANTAKNWNIGDRVTMYLGSPENPIK